VKAFKLNLLGLLIVGSMLLLNGGAAKADTIVDFTITDGGNTETFVLPLSPIPDSVIVGVDAFELDNVPAIVNGVSKTDNIRFFGTAEEGGLADPAGIGGLGLFNILTSQVFSGSLGDPTFLLGTFTGPGGAGGSITITDDVATTPLPAALPLFAAGLGAMGFAGRRRKRNASVA
jgi:hypothetical protein